MSVILPEAALTQPVAYVQSRTSASEAPARESPGVRMKRRRAYDFSS